MTRKSIAAAGVAILLVVATAGFVGLGAVGAQSATDDSSHRTISVSATESAEASPDQAVVRVSVTAQANSSTAVRDSLVAGTEDLRTALDELGVEYETARYSIEEQRRPPRYEERPPEGGESAPAPDYRGVHSFTVTLDDTDEVGSVIDAAADAGAEVNDISLTLSEEHRDELRNDAIEAAMADAKTQADTLAAAGDLVVTDVASIEASQQRYIPVRYEAAAADGGSGAAQTVVETGSVSVSYRVQVTYNATTSS